MSWSVLPMWGYYNSFCFDFSGKNSTEMRFVLRKKHKEHNIIRLTINKRGGI